MSGPWIELLKYPFHVVEIEMPFADQIRVTQGIGNRSPRYGMVWEPKRLVWRPKKPQEFGMHRGVDFALPTRTRIYAPEGGLFAYGFEPQKSGIYAKILFDLDDVTLEIFMAHLSDVMLAQKTRIKAGTYIAYSGDTGASTGPHLHLEVREFKSKIPYPFKFKE